MTSEQAIGVFDSGIGGLSIWREIVALLPYENTFYLADSKNAPYGQKPGQEIIDLCKKNTELLLEKGCKIIVVACNTATTNAISHLRDNYDIPFIGIEPAIKPAALQTRSNSIGVLATKGTLTSALFYETSQKFLKGVRVTEQIGEGLVPLIEKGQINSPEMTILLEKYLRPMIDARIDTLVLGCSHYPFLIPEIKNILGTNIKIIDSGAAVAKQTEAVLKQKGLLRQKNSGAIHKLYINTDKGLLQDFMQGSKLDYKLYDLAF